MRYFAGKDKAYALQIGEFKYFENPLDPRKCIKDFYPPQFFQYVDGEKLFSI